MPFSMCSAYLTGIGATILNRVLNYVEFFLHHVLSVINGSETTCLRTHLRITKDRTQDLTGHTTFT